MRNSTSRVSCADLKSSLVLALQLAEKGVDGLPIPGVKGCIGGILKIIEQEELREANIETFTGLVDKISRFERVTVERLSKERNLHEDLKSDVRVLAEKLQDIPARYNERIGKRSTTRRVKSFFSAKDHAEALNSLGEDLKSAIEEFHTSLLVNMQLADMKRDADRLIDKLPVERKSFYNAHRVPAIELCEPDTRVSLLATIANWAEDTGANNPRILWLNGRAGVGKSTIAKTLASRFDDGKTLGGSFMFSKPNGVTDGSKVFTTLAYQLAHHLPDFRDHLAAAIRANEKSIRAEIPKQFDDLLAAPLSQLHSAPVIMILLDALDECTPETLTPVLTAIVENIIRFPFLCFVVTSRPENPIREVLKRFTERIREMNISDIPTSKDIETYLQRRLRNAYTHLMYDAHQNLAWPAEDDLASLVEMANNLFIFAATAVRFIADERAADPQRRLEIILRGQHVGQKHPFSSLDIMYREILRNALPEGKDDLHERFQAVVGTIVHSVMPFSVDLMEWFLEPNYHYSVSNIRHSLKFLHSVLIVPEDDEKGYLQVYHKSFADFITDPKRCTMTEVYLRPSTHHARLCLRHLELAESTFHTAPSPNNFSDQPLDYIPGSVMHTVRQASTRSLFCMVHYSKIPKNGVIKDEKAEEVVLVVQDRARTFLKSLSQYKGSLVLLIEDPRNNVLASRLTETIERMEWAVQEVTS